MYNIRAFVRFIPHIHPSTAGLVNVHKLNGMERKKKLFPNGRGEIIMAAINSYTCNRKKLNIFTHAPLNCFFFVSFKFPPNTPFDCLQQYEYRIMYNIRKKKKVYCGCSNIIEPEQQTNVFFKSSN